MNAPRFLKSLERAQDRWELAKGRGLAFRQALLKGEIPAFTSPTYESWVRSQACASCWTPGPSEVSHLADEPYKSLGAKVPFPMVWPSCRECHEAYHQDRREFRALHADPIELCLLTVSQAIVEGVLVVKAPA